MILSTCPFVIWVPLDEVSEVIKKAVCQFAENHDGEITSVVQFEGCWRIRGKAPEWVVQRLHQRAEALRFSIESGLGRAIA